MSVHAVVDLTAQLGEVRHQANRPTCLAFALSELHRHGVALPLLSPEYLYRAAANLMPDWEPDLGLELGASLAALAGPGQPKEEECPYAHSEPAEMPPQVPLVSGSLHAANATAFRVDVHKVAATVAAGKPVGLVLQLTDTFMTPQGGIVEYSDLIVSAENHAVVAAGVGTHRATNEPHFLVRNTWGKSWGNQGSAWIPVQYVSKFGLAAFEVN